MLQTADTTDVLSFMGRLGQPALHGLLDMGGHAWRAGCFYGSSGISNNGHQSGKVAIVYGDERHYEGGYVSRKI